MRLLILGGSWFLGRAIAADAMSHGWTVTAFSRGRSGPPPTGVIHVQGDRRRDPDLTRLAAFGPWDAVIDTSAYEPVDVVQVTKALTSSVDLYVLISTVSAYHDWPAGPVDEESKLWPSSPTYTEASPELADLTKSGQYGTLKAGCERAAVLGASRTLIARPGVILGPGEYVGRQLKLLDRAARGGSWLLPGPADQSIQPIDVRDVARFLLHGIETGRDGVFNLVAPLDHSTYGELIDCCLELTGRVTEPVWVDPQWLTQREVRQWTEIPLWRTMPGTWQVDGRRAANAGLTCRPLIDSLRDFQVAIERDGLISHPRQAEHGLPSDREAALLAAWAQSASRARQRQG